MNVLNCFTIEAVPVPVADTSHADRSVSKPSTMGVRQLAWPSSVLTSADDASSPPLLVDEDDEVTSLGDPSRPPLDEEDDDEDGDFSSP